LYGIKTAFLSNSFSAYRKKALQEIGWFKDNLILGEDTYAGAKLLLKGYKIAYVRRQKFITLIVILYLKSLKGILI